MNACSLPPDRFVTLEGVRFHYLDWGGTGEPFLLLPGLGCSVHIFCEFAPQFTDHFHVIGFNRRGHGLSDMPASPPTIRSLAEDIRSFMDALALGRTILVGHSLGGREVSELAASHPERVASLIYLDSAVDMLDRNTELADPLASLQPEIPNVFPSYDDYVQYLIKSSPEFRPIWGRAFDANLRAGLVYHADGSVEERFKHKDAEPYYVALRQYCHPFGRITSPALAFFALSDAHPGIPEDADPFLRKEVATYWDEVVIPWKRAAIDRFLVELESSRAIELAGASHYVFIDRFEEVVHATRGFILGHPKDLDSHRWSRSQ